MMRFRCSSPVVGARVGVLLVFAVSVLCTLGAQSRRYPHCTGDPLTFYLAADSRLPNALKHHDISGRLRVFVKPDDSVDHIVFE
jgi:hypothetical protein